MSLLLNKKQQGQLWHVSKSQVRWTLGCPRKLKINTQEAMRWRFWTCRWEEHYHAGIGTLISRTYVPSIAWLPTGVSLEQASKMTARNSYCGCSARFSSSSSRASWFKMTLPQGLKMNQKNRRDRYLFVYFLFSNRTSGESNRADEWTTRFDSAGTKKEQRKAENSPSEAPPSGTLDFVLPMIQTKL